MAWLFRLGELGVDKKMIPAALRETIFKGLIEIASSLTFRDLCLLTRGFVGMNYDWKDLPPGLQESIVGAIIRNCDEVNPSKGSSSRFSSEERNIAGLIYGLGEIGMHWNDLPEDAQGAILQLLGQMTSSFSITSTTAILYG